MSIHLTDHARVRLQQRGISLPVLDCLLNFGRRLHDHHGAEICYFDRTARDRLRRTYGRHELKHLESKLNTYAVISADGTILTVGHRTKRINRH